MLDLRNLETFYYIVKLGTFHAAADKLCTTQPGISQRIALLEQDLGVKLFYRDTRRVSLTTMGEEILPRVEQMLELRQDIKFIVDNKQSVRGILRLGVPETLTYTWLPRFIQQLNALYPELSVEIQVSVSPCMETQLRNRQLDLIFTIGSMEDSDTESLPLCQYPMKWIAGPGLDFGSSSVISLENLAQLPMITSPPDTTYHALTQKPFRDFGTKSLFTCKTISLAMTLGMLHRNVGFALLVPAACSQMIKRGELRVIDVEGMEPLSSNYTSFWMKGPDSHIPSLVAQIAQQVAQKELSVSTAH